MHYFTQNKVPIIAIVLLILVGAGVWYFHHSDFKVNTATATNSIFTVATSTGANYFVITNDGRVGIGADDPHATLEVNGTLRLTAKSLDGCESATAGAIAYNPDNHHFWGCDGYQWHQLDN